MRPTARGLAYVSALLMAFGALTPWATVDGEPTFAPPELVAVLCGYALAVTVATVLRQRAALALGAVMVAGFSVVAIWTVPGSVLGSDASGVAAAEAGAGLVLMMVAAMLLYLASWLPAPQGAAAATADVQG